MCYIFFNKPFFEISPKIWRKKSVKFDTFPKNRKISSHLESMQIGVFEGLLWSALLIIHSLYHFIFGKCDYFVNIAAFQLVAVRCAQWKGVEKARAREHHLRPPFPSRVVRLVIAQPPFAADGEKTSRPMFFDDDGVQRRSAAFADIRIGNEENRHRKCEGDWEKWRRRGEMPHFRAIVRSCSNLLEQSKNKNYHHINRKCV